MIRIAIIGNSSIGALHKAYKQRSGYDITFVAKTRLSKEEELVGCDNDGTLQSYTHSNVNSKKILVSQFDFIFIYTDLRDPAIIGNHLAEQFYTTDLITKYVSENCLNTHAYQLAKKISHFKAAENIFIIPRNIENDFRLHQNTNHQAISILMEKQMKFKLAMLKSDIYDFPLAPNPFFYKDSVNIEQEVTYNKHHDKLHFNTHGGHKVLHSLYSFIDKKISTFSQNNSN